MQKTHVSRWAAIGLFVVALFGLQRAANAQALMVVLFGDKLSTERFQLGINADFVVSGYTGVSHDPRLSWAFGAYGEILLSEHWRLQPEFIFKTPVGAKEMPVTAPGSQFEEPTGDPTLDAIREDSTLTRTGNAITIPLLVKFVTRRWHFGLGGSIGFLTGATDELHGEVQRGGLTIDADSDDALNLFDAGLMASLSFAFKPESKMRSVRIDAKLYFGLTDTVKNNAGGALRNWQVFVGVDIPVGGSKAVKEEAGCADSDS